MEVKPVIVAKDGLARIGRDVIELVDKSVNQFKTNSLKDFIAMIINLSADEKVDRKTNAIFYSTTHLALRAIGSYHGQTDIAICSLQPHAVMQIISRVKDKPLSVQELDDFLFTVRDYYQGVEAKELYDRIQKLSVKKITSMTREKDRAGNYSYSAERKDGEGSVSFPAKISFNSPLFETMDHNTVIVDFDLFIDYSDGEKGPEISFTLKNPLFSEQIEQHCKNLIEEQLSAICSLDKYYGSMTTIEKTDSWKYQTNGL